MNPTTETYTGNKLIKTNMITSKFYNLIYHVNICRYVLQGDTSKSIFKFKGASDIEIEGENCVDLEARLNRIKLISLLLPQPSKHLLVFKTSSARLQRNNFTSSKMS